MSLPAGTVWKGGLALTPDGAVYVSAAGGAITGTTITATGQFLAANGSAAAPSYAWSSAIAGPATGFYRHADGYIGVSGNGTGFLALGGSAAQFSSAAVIQWASGALGSAVDVNLARSAAGILGLYENSTAVGASLRRYGGNAGYVEWGSVSENLTLSTSGATTDTAANLLPANSYIECVTGRITTTIATATNWKMGDRTTSGRFTAANSTLTAGTIDVGLVHCDVTGAGGPRQTAAAKVRVTTTGTPSAGAIRLTSYYRTFVGPTS